VAEALIVLRFVHFAAAMAAFGIGAFRLYAFAGAPPPLSAEISARLELGRQFRWMTAAAAVVLLLTALAMVPCVTAEMTGSAGAGFDIGMDRTMLGETEFGQFWCWHLGFAAVLLAAALVPASRCQAGLTGAAALLALASLGWVGHAAMDMGGGPVHQVNQMAHLIAAGAWLGGLLPLGVLLRRALRPEGGAYASLARTALPHFSQMGYIAVTLLVLTGTVNSVMLIGRFQALVTSGYGRLLMLKIVLFLAMVGFALVNRLRLLPRLHGRPPLVPLRKLCRSVLAEQAIGLGILAVVAVLGVSAPPMDGMAM
jgi:putative copper resistance protein D